MKLFSKKTSRVQTVTTNPMDSDFIVISPTRFRLCVNLHFDLVFPMFPLHIYLCDKPKIGSIDIGIVVFLLMTFLFWDYPMGLALRKNNPNKSDAIQKEKFMEHFDFHMFSKHLSLNDFSKPPSIYCHNYPT